MILKGQQIYLRLLVENDAEALLHLEGKNREFFQNYAPLRADTYYTLEYQRLIIRDHLWEDHQILAIINPNDV